MYFTSQVYKACPAMSGTMRMASVELIVAGESGGVLTDEKKVEYGFELIKYGLLGRVNLHRFTLRYTTALQVRCPTPTYRTAA
jgi:hypothetical protein